MGMIFNILLGTTCAFMRNNTSVAPSLVGSTTNFIDTPPHSALTLLDLHPHSLSNSIQNLLHPTLLCWHCTREDELKKRKMKNPTQPCFIGFAPKKMLELKKQKKIKVSDFLSVFFFLILASLCWN